MKFIQKQQKPLSVNRASPFTALFKKTDISSGCPLLVHVRLKRFHEQSGISYKELAKELYECLLDCKPSLLLIPTFTIYPFVSNGIFHLEYSRSEEGRFSEEMRLAGLPRTFDPMFSMLDPLRALPNNIQYLNTFGKGSLMEYLRHQDTIIVNVDMPGFYATPIHCVERDNAVPYRFEKTFYGKMQQADEPWQEVSYTSYIRKINQYGNGSYPAYNYQRRSKYLKDLGLISTVSHNGLKLEWTHVASFCKAIDKALQKDPYFLVDTTN